MPKLLVESSERILMVSINRPEVRNAVDAETAGMLLAAARQFQQDSSLDVMVLTGTGEDAFCSGADLKNIEGLVLREGASETGPMGISRITDLAKPTIAAVNGFCLAGGLELACWCDFRIAAENARFSVANRRWGVPLIDGGTQRLPRIVGLGNALYLIETGMLIDARQALRMGLVQELVPAGQALTRALELARIISAYPATSLRNDRCAAYEGLSLSLPEGLRMENDRHNSSLKDPGLAEGLRRYAAGDRPPPPQPPH
ncbi:MAG: enoyl-CoA hydratase/isomerase family protein [Dehalococcoidia bacterium]|nr:enoyl-CoA hydratase/isomerase family protein [Dehalococcoidia bacterium]